MAMGTVKKLRHLAQMQAGPLQQVMEWESNPMDLSEPGDGKDNLSKGDPDEVASPKKLFGVSCWGDYNLYVHGELGGPGSSGQKATDTFYGILTQIQCDQSPISNGTKIKMHSNPQEISEGYAPATSPPKDLPDLR